MPAGVIPGDLHTDRCYSAPRRKKQTTIIDGKELFYLPANNKLTAVKDENGFEAGVPEALFETRSLDRNPCRYPYAVTADGQPFLLLKPMEHAARPLTAVQNWTAVLKQ